MLSQLSQAMAGVEALKAEVAARDRDLRQRVDVLQASRDAFQRDAEASAARVQQLRTHNAVLQRQCDDFRQRLADTNRSLTASRRDNAGLRAEQAYDRMSASGCSPNSSVCGPSSYSSDLVVGSTSMGHESWSFASRPRTLQPPPAPGSTPPSSAAHLALGAALDTPAGKLAPVAPAYRRDEPARARRIRRATRDNVEEVAEQYAVMKADHERLSHELATAKEVCRRQAEELTRMKLTSRTYSLGSPAGVMALPSFSSPGRSPGGPVDVDALNRSADGAYHGARRSRLHRPRQSESLYLPADGSCHSPLLRGDGDPGDAGSGGGTRPKSRITPMSLRAMSVTRPDDFGYTPLPDAVADDSSDGRCCVIS